MIANLRAQVERLTEELEESEVARHDTAGRLSELRSAYNLLLTRLTEKVQIVP